MTRPRRDEDSLLTAHLAKRLTAYSAAAGVVLAMSPRAEAAIRWFQPATPLTVDHSTSISIDMDNDGIPDFSFAWTGSTFDVASVVVNRKHAANRFDGTGNVAQRLLKGYVVHPTLDVGAALLMRAEWDCLPSSSARRIARPMTCYPTYLWGAGAFNEGASGYVGVRFRGGVGEDYNGWIHFTGGTSAQHLSGRIDEWAYEDSGGAIKAGASTIAHAFLDDLNGNGFSEYALLRVIQGASYFSSVLTNDIVTRTRIKEVPCLGPQFRPVGMTRINNVDGNGNPALAILGVRENAAKEILAVRVELRNPATGSLIRNIGFAKGYRPSGLRWLNRDMNGNGVGEMAVLGTHPATGRSVVEIRDLLTGALVKRITVGPDSTVESIGLSYSNDLNGNGSQELVILQRNAKTLRSRLNIVDTKTGKRIKTIPCLSESWVPVGIASVGDLNGNKSLEQGILARRATANKVVVKIIDVRTGSILRTVSFNSRYSPQALATGDVDGNGVHELGVLGTNPADATNRIEIRDPVTGSLKETILIP